MNLTIDKGIPLPARKYPVSKWLDLAIGDSALVTKYHDSCNAVTWARRNGRLFTRRKVDGGYRVWRVE